MSYVNREQLRKDLLLYAVTDRSWLGNETLYEQVEKALKGGATFIQLREKELDEEHFMEEAVDADQVIVLSDGQVLCQGTPHGILTDQAMLKKAGLLPPFAAQMAMELRDAGIPIAQTCITTRELVEEICRLQ